jgi:hypothetical protein
MHSVCHIARLPVELLEIIFDDLVIITRQSPVALCMVCSHWRTIISRYSRYWKTLVLRSTTTVPKMKQRIKLAGGEVQRLFVYGMETERFIRLAPVLGPALENVEEVHFEASRQHFSHVANAGILNCSPRTLMLRGMRYANYTSSLPFGVTMMSNKLKELYISSFDPDWNTFLGLTPSLEVLHVSDGGVPPHIVLTNMLIDLPRLESLSLDGRIARNNWPSLVNRDLPDPLPAVLPSVRKLEVRLRPKVLDGTVYRLRAPAQAHQLQYLLLEGCRVLWWLDSLLAPPTPPIIELYIHFPRDTLRAQDITQNILTNLGRTLERFAFTDTSMSLVCLVPLLRASERLQWLNLSRTLVDREMLSKFLAPRSRESLLSSMIVHGCRCLTKDAVDWARGYIPTIDTDASDSPPPLVNMTVGTMPCRTGQKVNAKH